MSWSSFRFFEVCLGRLARHVAKGARVDELPRRLGSGPALDPHVLARHLGGGHEERLELRTHARVELVDVAVARIVCRYCDDAIVVLARRLRALALREAHDADRLARDDDPGPRRAV